MNVIYKYPLRIDDHQEIELPIDSVPLVAEFQDGQLCLWVKRKKDVKDSAVPWPMRKLCIRIAGTGHDIDDEGWQFLNTAFDPARPLVWHVFWKIV